VPGVFEGGLTIGAAGIRHGHSVTDARFYTAGLQTSKVPEIDDAPCAQENHADA
jgi:hypothetical protein